jgi:hypothetical protein
MSKKPKVLLTIGSRNYLLPDDTNITVVMKTLSKAVECRDWLFQNELHLLDAPELAMKYVSAGTKFKGVGGEDLPTQPAKKERPVKALPSSERNLLNWKP